MPKTLVSVPTNRDKVLRYLDVCSLAQSLLAQRLATWGRYAAYVQLVRDAIPDLQGAFEDDVAEAVYRALRARLESVVAA